MRTTSQIRSLLSSKIMRAKVENEGQVWLDIPDAERLLVMTQSPTSPGQETDQMVQSGRADCSMLKGECESPPCFSKCDILEEL